MRADAEVAALRAKNASRDLTNEQLRAHVAALASALRLFLGSWCEEHPVRQDMANAAHALLTDSPDLARLVREQEATDTVVEAAREHAEWGEPRTYRALEKALAALTAARER